MATKELTAEEKRQFDMKRTQLFKGTIAVIVIYGTLLLLLSLVGIFSEMARQTIFIDGFVFTVTLMAGIVLVIIALLVQIFTYKEAPREVVVGENMVCPEYWELTKTPADQLEKITNPKAKALSTYYCRNPSTTTGNPFNSTGLTLPPNQSNAEPLKTLQSIADVYNVQTIDPNNTFSLKLTCSRLYPEYMAYMDKTNFKDAPTTLRKEYLNQCANNPQGTSATSPTIKIDWPAVSP